MSEHKMATWKMDLDPLKKTLVWSIFNVSFFNFIDGFQHFLTRDARWFVFKPKIQNWVNFGGPFNGKCRYIL
jgi:hypothetical protein